MLRIKYLKTHYYINRAHAIDFKAVSCKPGEKRPLKLESGASGFLFIFAA